MDRDKKIGLRAYTRGGLIILISFALIRGPLFKYHGMLQWPLIMLGLALASWTLLFSLKKKRSYFASLGYLISFFLALVLSTRSYDQGGGALSDGWKLWLIIYLLIVIMVFILNGKKEVK